MARQTGSKKFGLTLTRQAGLIMTLLVLVATTGMFAAVILVDKTEGIPGDINQAGSLRMLSMRIAHMYERHYGSDQFVFSTVMNGQIRQFEDRLLSSGFQQLLVEATNPEVASAFGSVKSEWEEIKGKLLQRAMSPEGATTRLWAFVDRIDYFVRVVQAEADKKLSRVRWIIAAALWVTFLLALFAVVRLYRVIVIPLRGLMTAAQRVQSGDFSQKVPVRRDDELGQLSSGFNVMTERLAEMYGNLEQKVAEKTRDLQQKNQALEILYTSARLLSENIGSTAHLTAILERLEKLEGVEKLVLCLEPDLPRIGEVALSGPDIASSAVICADKKQCSQCPVRKSSEPSGAEVLGRHETHRLAVSCKQRRFGQLFYVKKTHDGSEEAHWVDPLMATIAEHFGATFYSLEQLEKESRLMLMEERATIARELHDSLAQSLSYLKFRLGRFHKMIEAGDDREALIVVLEEIKSGLNSAYSQLREMLTSFRLKLSEPGLLPALKGAVAEFSQRGQLDIQLEYPGEGLHLNANQEVHILQIVREALSNVVKHAKATIVRISLEKTASGEIEVRVSDNGVGMESDAGKRHHHGLAIMAERAKSLGGVLEVSSETGGGTKVVCKIPTNRVA